VAIEVTPAGTRGSTTRINNRIVVALFIAFYRLLGGRGLRVLGVRTLLLTTVGAKTGRMRTQPVAYFADGEDSWLVVASAAGAARHPAYYINMAKNPDRIWIQVGRRKLRVKAESLRGTLHEQAWRRIVVQSQGFQAYQDKTDRLIPIVRLSDWTASPA
jgi:deazaflavin-dependent oxidoreductase (nitroreductase family)